MQLIEKAEETFGDGIESKLMFAADVPDGDWVGAVSMGMNGLATLNHGRRDVNLAKV